MLHNWHKLFVDMTEREEPADNSLSARRYTKISTGPTWLGGCALVGWILGGIIVPLILGVGFGAVWLYQTYGLAYLFGGVVVLLWVLGITAWRAESRADKIAKVTNEINKSLAGGKK